MAISSQALACVTLVFWPCSMLMGQAEKDNTEVPGLKDLNAMQGVWKVVESYANTEDGAKRMLGATVTIKGNKLRTELNPKGDDTSEVTIERLDPSRSPRVIDIISKRENQQPKRGHGIYAIEGDELRFSFATMPGDQRPKSFDVDPEGLSQATIILKKVNANQ